MIISKLRQNTQVTLKSAINLITQNNVFIFNGKFYRQIDRAPIGSSIFGLMAEIKLGPIENQVMEIF